MMQITRLVQYLEHLPLTTMMIENIDKYFSEHDVYVVVGFKKNSIMENFPQLAYVYNPYFDQTNTAKSLVRALKKCKGESVLWFNGDVVFDEKLLEIPAFLRSQAN